MGYKNAKVLKGGVTAWKEAGYAVKKENGNGEEKMKELLKGFKGKMVRIYTVSGVESYLGRLEEVKDDYLVLKSFFKEDKTYLAIQYIESFKEEIPPA